MRGASVTNRTLIPAECLHRSQTGGRTVPSACAGSRSKGLFVSAQPFPSTPSSRTSRQRRPSPFSGCAAGDRPATSRSASRKIDDRRCEIMARSPRNSGTYRAVFPSARPSAFSLIRRRVAASMSRSPEGNHVTTSSIPGRPGPGPGQSEDLHEATGGPLRDVAMAGGTDVFPQLFAKPDQAERDDSRPTMAGPSLRLAASAGERPDGIGRDEPADPIAEDMILSMVNLGIFIDAYRHEGDPRPGRRPRRDAFGFHSDRMVSETGRPGMAFGGYRPHPRRFPAPLASEARPIMPRDVRAPSPGVRHNRAGFSHGHANVSSPARSDAVAGTGRW